MGDMPDEATTIVRRRLDASKRVEAELRLLGNHQDAELLAELRKGYSSAIQTCKRLYRDNMALRTTAERGEGEA